MRKTTLSFEERLKAKIQFAGQDECWLWIGNSKAGRGYGVLCKTDETGKKQVYAHREMLRMYKGEPPAGLDQALHSCDNPLCCNPNHLSWGNNKRNRKEARDRLNNQGKQKLTAAQVEEIRKDTRSLKEIAAAYGVHRTTIGDIKKGRAWHPI